MNITGINTRNNNFKIINGTLPIILSAPHAVKQCRNGKIKEEDKLTGAIVEYLCMKTGINGIIRTCNYNDDPNYENSGEALKYKEAILKLIKEKNIRLLIDVHGCTNQHGFDIELGTNYGENIDNDESYIEILKQEFSQLGKVAIDEEFKAERTTTVSNFIHKNSGIPCIQIEISTKFRKEQLVEMLKVFESAIKKYVIKFKGDIIKDYDEISK